ncbi:hypothetical protein [Rhodococcus zopfii]|uniref:hypothetical protein n=1 Tax=Rhodococcus zopfii TaxID=43772 RepID=UPI0035280ECB
MFSNTVGGDTIEARLTALDAIVDGLLDDDMTGFSRDDLAEFFQRFETVLRKATAVGHRAVVEAAERRVPEDLGCRSINDFLIGTLRICAADAARRVKGARKVGVWHTTDWKDGGPTDITNDDLACDACHALVHDGPGGWATRVAPPDAEYPGRTEWIPPPHIAPEQTPQVNHRHHLGDLLSAALAHYRARRDTELREHRRRWLREPAGDVAGGEVP